MIDAERRGDGAVHGKGAKRAADERALEGHVAGRDDEHRERERDECGRGKHQAADRERAGAIRVQVGRDLLEVSRPDVAHRLDQDDQEPEAEQERVELGHRQPVEAPLEDGTGGEQNRNRDGQGEHRVDMPRRGKLEREVGAEKNQPEVREIDDPEYSPRER